MFARLPYVTAYLLWLFISVLLYLAGVIGITRRFLSRNPLHVSLVCCLALSFYPFAVSLIVQGHLSAIGFFAVALAILAEGQGNQFLSGLALSACLYKPTLVVLLLPMLLVTGRVKAILGFFAGGAGLVLLATILKGAAIWPGFFRMSRNFAELSVGLDTRSFLNLENYVDLTSFSSLFPGGRSRIGLTIIAACIGWIAFALVKAWWKSRAAGKPVTTLIWAATLTWTPVVNLYVPMYDSILVVLGLIMTAGALKILGSQSFNHGFNRLYLALYASCWIAQRFAGATGIQIITILLAGLGIFQFALLREMAELHPAPERA
jgi:hypothetical protein